MALPPSTTITVVPITNPRLVAAAHDFQSITEHKDLPRKVECLDDAETVLWSTDSNFPCQVGCGDEKPFAFLVEPGDTIPLQFQLPDYLNADPEDPELGWREAAGDYWLELEVLDTDGNVIWSGPTEFISQHFEVGWSGIGFQTVVVDVDMLLQQLPKGTTCWSFRVKVFFTLDLDYTAVDAETAPSGAVPVGYTYIDFGTNEVLQWDGVEWDVIGPNGVKDTYYVVETGHWYQWNGSVWVGLADPPEHTEPAFDFVYTMNYKLRHCDEPIIKVCCTLAGRDCLGFQHDPKPPEYLMDPVPGLTFVDFWIRDGATPIPGLFVGATATGPTFNSILTYTADGWVVGPPLAPGTQILVMNDGLWPWIDAGAGYTPVDILAGSIMEVGAWVPFVGYWDFVGMLWEEFPGVQFIQGFTESTPFQLCFGLSGSLEVDEFGIETEVTRNARRLTTMPSTRGRLRTSGIPEHVAKLLQLALSASSFTVNGEAWDESEGLRKNNDDGAHWWIDTALVRQECEVRGLCE